MKYSSIFFDWGDTLSPLNSANVPILSTWVGPMIKSLYARSYRLAIISNTHRYQDGQWIRNELAKHGLLQYFEVVVSSATYAVHKPTLKIFEKALKFMQVDPRKVVMVGDSEHCDGAGQYPRHDVSKSCAPGENWHNRLMSALADNSTRKLTPIYEYTILSDGVAYSEEWVANGDPLRVKVRHLSEPLEVGDRFLLNETEFQVVRIPRQMTKQEILKAKDEIVEFGVIPVSSLTQI
jgi:hypothetical protein